MNEPEVPLIPPPDFVARLNAARAEEGLPPLGALDGITMLCWHTATETLRHPQPLCIVTGI